MPYPAYFPRLAQKLRSNIASGKWRPGQRIPNRLDLANDLRTSTATVQKAMTQLLAEGFLEARQGAGTFVASRPPNRWHIGLAVSHPPKLFSHSRILSTLCDVAEQLTQSGPIRIVTYRDVTYERDDPSRQRLLNDVAEHRLAGVMTAMLSWSSFRDTVMLRRPNLARLSILDTTCPGVPAVDFVYYVEQMMRWFAARGRKRFAALYVALGPDAADHAWQANVCMAAAHKLHMTTRLPWIVPVHPSVPQAAGLVAQLLVANRDPEHRPDALWIADDHLVESATAGLRQAGIRIPADLDVVAHRNFPDLPTAHVPVLWAGPDLRQLLRESLALMDQQFKGKTPPAETHLPATFDDQAINAQTEPAR